MLILTIIIMIILATAVILSLNSSGIIDRATKAKNDSDMATIKEYVSMLEAEWELMTKDERKDYLSKEDYINAKLEEEGYKDIYYAEGGIVETDTVAMIKYKNIPIGAEVKGYALSEEVSAKSTTTDGNENDNKYMDNYHKQATITRDENISWRYIGTDNDGNVLIAGDVTASSSKIEFSGYGGYENGPALLNTICSTLYSGTMGSARSMNIDDVVRVLEYTGETSGYYSFDTDKWVPTTTAEKIAKILDEHGWSLICTGDSCYDVPDSLLADYFEIEKADTDYNSDRAGLVFLTETYWLATTADLLYLDSHVDPLLSFCVFRAGALNVFSVRMYDHVGYWAYPDGYDWTYSIRPVVVLNNDVQFTYSNGVITLG